MSTTELRPASLPGRSDAVASIVTLAAHVIDGEGGGLTIVGEPGIGKTTVLDRSAEEIAFEFPEVRIIRLRGVEAEFELAWSCLGGLLDGLLGGLDQLAPARAAALRAALAIERSAEPVEPFAVALAARDLLVDAAEERPIMVLVDDMRWVDVPTRRALSFIARRLQFDRVGIVSARRVVTDESLDTGPVIELDSVPDDVADRILRDAGVTSPVARRQLVAAGGGIPLALVEAANLLDADQREGRADLPDPMPIGPSGQRVVDLLLERLPTSARAALVVAAADPDGDLLRILHALSTRGLSVTDLEAAEGAGVITLDGDHLAFRHPLMRSAAYHDAARADRRAAHRALADALPVGSTARAWHLARAAVGPDEEVARALDEAAAITARRGAPSVAGRTWELASRLSPDSRDRVRRLRLAASAVLDAGMAGAAGHLLDRADEIVDADPGSDDLVERIGRRQLRCRLPLSSGGAPEAAASLRKASAEVAGEAPSVAVDLLLDALAAYMRSGAMADMASAIEDAVLLQDRVDDDRARRIDVMFGALLYARGDPAGERRLDRYVEMTGPDRPAADAMFLAEVLAPTLGFLRRSDDCDALLAGLEADLRARGAVRPLVSVLGAQSLAHYSRSFPATVASGNEAISLAENNGTPELASLAAAVLALCSAVIGDEEMNRRAAALLSDVPEPERRALGPIGSAYLAFNLGRFEEADVLYRNVLELSPIGQGFVRWETEWIECLSRLDRRDEACAVLAELESVMTPELLVYQGVERTKGALAESDDEAFDYFAKGLAAAVQQDNRFAAGRVELAWGERLRRARRRAEARGHLEQAVELLRAVGAAVPAERATQELRAAGGVVGDAAGSHQLLTPHELQVARLVVGGASNRDLAAKLFISPRTVEAHLTAIFRKLGVRNRRELAARALDDPVLQP